MKHLALIWSPGKAPVRVKTNRETHSDRKRSILVAEDHEVMRRGIRTVVEAMDGWEICREVTTGVDAVRVAEELRPHIAILDVVMSDMNGIEAARRIKSVAPETEILILTGHETDELVCQAIEAGAKSFISKTDGREPLEAAIRALSQNELYLTPRIREILHARGKSALRDGGEGAAALTNRERETVRLLASGLTNQETADAMGVSIKTVETHRAAAMRKLELESFAELVRYAVRNHFVPK